MPFLRSAVLGSVSLLVLGCFRYVPARPAEVAAPARVRIHVAPPGRVYVESDSGARHVQGVVMVVGQMTAARGDTLLLRDAGLVYSTRPWRERELRGESHFLLEPEDRLRVRRLDKVRTVVAVGVPVAILAYILATFEYTLGPSYPAP